LGKRIGKDLLNTRLTAAPRNCTEGIAIQNAVVHPCFSIKFATGFRAMNVGQR
jgi:hypothetical protein